jgi:DNA-binding response OmpR family regulator
VDAPTPPTPPGAEIPLGVLVVEDEEPLRRLIGRVLAASGYAAVLASTAAGAIERARTLGPGIDVILLDRVLPDGAGPRLGVVLRELCPRAGIVHMSGYAGGLGGAEGVTVLQKPFEPKELLDAVRAALASRA